MTLNKLASFNDRFPVSLKTFDKVKPRDFFCALSKSVTHGSELKTKVSKLQKTFVFCSVFCNTTHFEPLLILSTL